MGEDLYFVFNGESSLDYNIVFDKLPHHGTPQRNVDLISVPGRNGKMVIDNGAYDNKTITLEASVYGESEEEKLNYMKLLKKWLQKDFSYQSLYFSDELECEYKAMCVNKIDFNEIATTFDKFLIIFECMPLKYLDSGKCAITINQVDSKIYNPGTEESEPYIKVTGTGDVTIYINNPNQNQTLILKELTDFLEVDTEMVNCYRTDNVGALIPKNNQMYSDFPTLLPGETIISWLGNVSKIEIIPRWVEK